MTNTKGTKGNKWFLPPASQSEVEKCKSAVHLAVYLAVKSFVGGGVCWASRAKIAKRSRVSVRSITEATGFLAEVGLIKLVSKKVGPKGGRPVNHWVLGQNFPNQRIDKENLPQLVKEKTTPKLGQNSTPKYKGKGRKQLTNEQRLLAVDSSFLSELQKKFPRLKVRREWEKVQDYLRSKGQVREDYRAYLRNWLRRAEEGLPPEKKSNAEKLQEVWREAGK